MTKHEYNLFQNMQPAEKTISVGELRNKSDRTLLYGYDTDRNTYHTYLKHGRLNHVVKTGNKTISSVHDESSLPLEGLVPNKRLYPERCDLEFCSLLKEKDVAMTFTTFSENNDWVDPIE